MQVGEPRQVDFGDLTILSPTMISTTKNMEVRF